MNTIDKTTRRHRAAVLMNLRTLGGQQTAAELAQGERLERSGVWDILLGLEREGLVFRVSLEGTTWWCAAPEKSSKL